VNLRDQIRTHRRRQDRTRLVGRIVQRHVVQQPVVGQFVELPHGLEPYEVGQFLVRSGRKRKLAKFDIRPSDGHQRIDAADPRAPKAETSRAPISTSAFSPSPFRGRISTANACSMTT